MRSFDATTISLAGPRLVEASAGTGKTHAITTLVVRLVVEQDIAVDRILVVTFTEAATAELRARIRDRLRTALRAAKGEATGDSEIESVVLRSDEARSRLAVALTNVDRAAVFTIHGFCHRTLLDSAFDSGARFDVELLTDTHALRDEVLLDFWTDRLVDADPAIVRLLRARKVKPAQLSALVSKVARDPTMPVLPLDVAGAAAPGGDAYARAIARAAEVWDRPLIERLILESTALNGNKYRAASVPGWCDDVDAILTPGAALDPSRIHESLHKLTASSLQSGVKKQLAGREPKHPFFEVWQEVVSAAVSHGDAAGRYALGFKQELTAYVRRELALRKERLGVMGFDDLLSKLARALATPASGPRLAAAVRARFPVALIDEFQDTDPTQWDIFRTIYGDGDVVLIGDPKQAIYGFRGADVFAYLAAAQHVPVAGRFTMDVSWRSDPSLIDAVGSLFERLSSPFAIEAIRHVRLGPRPGAEDELQGAAPFEILFAERGRDKRILSDRLPRLPHAIAADIRALLDGDVTLGGAPVRPADVAVLTRTNRQAFEMQHALSILGVHSVVLGDQSVFEDDQAEARELSLVLRAIAEPTNSMALRSALTTELFGVTALQLAAMEEDEDTWDGWVERFRVLSEMWHGRGFVQMFRALMRTTAMVERLLGLERGERRVTNLLHLMELLQTAASTQHLGPAALLGWLEASRRPETVKARPEAAQIRLESDAHAVRVTTVHRSKGLEYPIVYCPYLADGSLLFKDEKAEVAFHDPADEGRLKLDLRGDAEHVALAEHERFAENLRLMYVALTRAKHRCVVVWGALGRSYETSPLGYLLHAPPLAGGEPSVGDVKSHIASLTDARMLEELEELVRPGMRLSMLDLDAAGVGTPLAEDAPPRLAARVVTNPIRGGLRTASFSELTADKSSAHREVGLAAGRDHDAHGQAASLPTRELVASEEPITLHAFPRGPKAGDFFHDVLESLDFADDAALRPLVEERLRGHGYPEEHADDVERALREALRTPLPTGLKRTMRLCDVPREDRLDELEFYFPVANSATAAVPQGAQLSLSFSGAAATAVTPLSPRELARPFREHRSDELDAGYAERVAQLRFAPLEGFLKGYIDLVFRRGGRFYVVDYKSNHLGDHLSDYGAASLREAMSHGHYYLQAHLYAVAVHRFLQRRLAGYRYDKNFGGVLYLFLKGMRPDSAETGVFFEKPPVQRIEQLSDILATPPHATGWGGRP